MFNNYPSDSDGEGDDQPPHAYGAAYNPFAAPTQGGVGGGGLLANLAAMAGGSGQWAGVAGGRRRRGAPPGAYDEYLKAYR